jgi:uncharacterized protein (DUF488 family)
MQAKKLRHESQPVILTIGHSTRPVETFIDLLKSHSVTHLIDVRTVPRSRHNPQFNQDIFSEALESAGIRYTHAIGLGGFRRTSQESPNQGWRNDVFRGYADYMQTEEFSENLAELIKQAKQERIALMCAEAVPWRCHRSLIADALTVQGIRVEEIVSKTSRQLHLLTPFAKVEGTAITYPPYE